MVLRRIRPPTSAAKERRDPARPQLDARHAEPRTAAGGRSTPTTCASSSTRFRSPTWRRCSISRPPTSPAAISSSWATSTTTPKMRAPKRAARVHASRTQEPSGSWWGRWGVNYIYGTWSVLAGLRAIGEDLGGRTRSVAPCVWLKSVRTTTAAGARPADSYGDAVARGPGAEHAVADRLGGSRPARRRARRQPRAGAWHRVPRAHPGRRRHLGRDEFTGTGFPRHFYLRYYMYRLLPADGARPVRRAPRGCPAGWVEVGANRRVRGVFGEFTEEMDRTMRDVGIENLSVDLPM